MSASDGQKYENQLKTFRFLREMYKSQEIFTKAELQVASGWSASTFNTYWPKQLKQLLVQRSATEFRVSESFLRVFLESDFLDYVSQVRSVASDYKYSTYGIVLGFEFFMPLSHEHYLRKALDNLFYIDSIIRRLKSLNSTNLFERFPRLDGESPTEYFDRVANHASNYFGGYSISHVQGRFRAGPLLSHAEAAKLLQEGGKYLIDETTAVARFIVPCTSIEEAKNVRWLFLEIFVQGIIQVVNGEEEVWMLESGVEPQLHVWSV